MPLDSQTIQKRLTEGLDAVILGHANRTLQQEERDVAKYRELMLTDQEGKRPEPAKSEGGEMFDGAVILGDLTVERGPETPNAPPPAPKGKGTLAKAALLATGVVAGGGAGAGVGWLLHSLLNRDEPPPVVVPQPKDPETRIIEREHDVRVLQPIVEPPG